MVYCIRKTNLSKWHNKEVVKQKIELLNAIRSKDEPIAIEIDNKIFELRKEKPMKKKYRLKKDYKLTSNIIVLRGKIFYTTNDGSYLIIESFDVKFNIPIQVVEFNPDWFEEVKEWGKLESILTDFALRIQGGYGNPDYNFFDDVCEISNKISELQKEIEGIC